MDLDNYGPVPARDYDYVVCSKCGSEFQPHVKNCIDCGAPTVPPGAAKAPRKEELEEVPEEEEIELPLSQDPEVALLYTGNLLWAEELKKRCEAQGIPGWLEEAPTGSGGVYRLYVPRRELKRARDIHRQYYQEEVPDAAELAELPPAGVCPFCNQHLPAGALECPGCGLVLALSDAPAATSDLQIVQALYAALEAGDGDRVLEILDPDVEWIQNEGFPGGGRFVGAETVYEKVFNRLADEWEGWGAEVGRWLEAEDSVVALGAYRGTFRKTGKSMRAAFAHVYWLDDGRIARFEQYADTAKIAEACEDD